MDENLRWSKKRSLWLLTMYAGAAAGAFPAYSPTAALTSSALAVVFLCGFTVGFHRGFIHGSFRTYRWLERLLLYLATLNGFGGLLQMFRKHELRDYWQNQPEAPAYYGYRHGLWRDYLWYLHLDHLGPEPAGLRIEGGWRTDRFLLGLDRHWMAHQVLFGTLLWLAGGWPLVVWGVCVRISTTTTGIWLVNYLVHKHGYRNFELAGCTEEGRNSLWVGALSLGEGWHNNHHAFPQSARYGVQWWEFDAGYLCIRLLETLGLVWEVKTFEDQCPRPNLRPVCPWCGAADRPLTLGGS